MSRAVDSIAELIRLEGSIAASTDFLERDELFQKFAEIAVSLGETMCHKSLRMVVLPVRRPGSTAQLSYVTLAQLRKVQPAFLDLSTFDEELRDLLVMTRDAIRDFVKNNIAGVAVLRTLWGDPEAIANQLDHWGMREELTKTIRDWPLDRLSQKQKTSFLHDCALDDLVSFAEWFEAGSDS